MRGRSRAGRRGGAVLEFAFFVPWYIFLFIGVFDWGFIARALISTQNAARVAVLYNSQMNSPTDASSACTYALNEFRSTINIPSDLTTCDSAPLIVTATQVTGPDGAAAAQVAIEYQTQDLIPLPAILGSQHTFRFVATMKL